MGRTATGFPFVIAVQKKQVLVLPASSFIFSLHLILAGLRGFFLPVVC
jgi:hypothetical protein